MILDSRNKIIPFWIITISLMFVLIFSKLIQDGMFMDGMIYISVSKNLSDGIGTFWNPHFSKTLMSSYHEQPPLYFGLLAVFYKFFGTSMYVERFFCFVFFTLTALYIHKLWKKIYSNQLCIANNSWLPIFIWFTIPVCFWTYANIVEEAVMALFAISSVYYIYCAIFLNKNSIYNLILAGIFIFLSSFTKGMQGLFPMVAVIFYWLIFRNIKLNKVITYSFILVGTPVIAYTLLITNPNAIESYKSYFSDRLISTFNNVGNTTENRFELFIRLLTELLPITALGGIILFFTRKHKNKIYDPNHNKIIFWFILIGLSGSLPLMVTLEQRGFYLVTTFPFFAIAIGMWLAPGITLLINKINTKTKGFKIFKTTTIILLLISISYFISNIGTAKRDKELLSDIYDFNKIIPRGQTVGIPSEMFDDWVLHAYMARYNYISLDISGKRHQYFIIDKSLSKKHILEGYKIYPVNTKKIDLYVVEQ